MKTLSRITVSSLLLLGLSLPAFASGSTQHAAASVEHSVQAVAHSTAAGVKLVSGAVAVPLMLSGEIGKAAGEIGEALWEEANTPLPIADEVITAGPSPAEAMEKEAQ